MMIAAFALFALFTGAVEGGLRALGYTPSVTDDGALWALAFADRQPQEWLVVGSSRSACAIDAATIERLTGQPVRNLALTGGNALPVVELLDERGFSGRLFLEVSPALMFGDDPAVVQQTAATLTALHTQETALFGGLERRATLALQARLLVLHSELDGMDLAKAALARTAPVISKSFDADRQRRCWPSREGVWPDVPPPDPAEVATTRDPEAEACLDTLVAALGRITARGGQVVLWQPPERGDKRLEHLRDWPDPLWFDTLVARTGLPAVNSTHDPELDAFPVPDGSHLDADDALVFTERLVRRFQAVGALPRP